jgi:DNA repair protein RadA/Sms
MARVKKIQTRACRMCNVAFNAERSQCPSCGSWHVPQGMWGKAANGVDLKDETLLLSEVAESEVERILTGPWDKCFGGGIARTAVNLIGGEPGAGKSTIALHIADEIANKTTTGEVLYVGAEESAKEVKARAARIGIKNYARIRILPMGAIAELGDVLLSRRPCAVMLDSLPGFVSDPEEAVVMCQRLKAYAVELNAPMLVIDHVNKDRDFAGLMKLQHAVDGLFTLFKDFRDGMPDSMKELRVMSVEKNRFGPAGVEVHFLMTETGLRHVCLEDLLHDDDDDDDS